LEIEESFGVAEHFAERDFSLVIRAHGPYFKGAPALGLSADARAIDRCAAEARAVRYADGISAPSQYILDAISKEWDLDGIPTVVIPNPAVPAPADLRWKRTTSEPFQILYVGRFDRLKGADLLLQAFDLLVAKRLNVELLFAGPDSGLVSQDGRVWMLREYAEVHLSPNALLRMRYLGVVTRDVLREYRQKATVCVVASREESFSYAALEALGAACPLVASDSGGVPEIVMDEHNGLLFRSGDAQALAAQLGRVVEDAELSERLSEGARDSVSRYCPVKIAAETLDFYSRVVANRSRRDRA
jgi:glycosyltransferase involved in cell wall biosynthesis